jgi:hypothetical protein
LFHFALSNKRREETGKKEKSTSEVSQTFGKLYDSAHPVSDFSMLALKI